MLYFAIEMPCIAGIKVVLNKYLNLIDFLESQYYNILVQITSCTKELSLNAGLLFNNLLNILKSVEYVLRNGLYNGII